MPPHRVPTHLETPDGIGKLSMRQIGLGLSGVWIASQAWERIPPVGPALGNLIRAGYPGLGLPEGALPLVPVAAAVSVLAPFLALAVPIKPPPEHGLWSATAWLKQHGLLGPSDVAAALGSLEVDGNVITSDFGYHAVWELPSQNLRLADSAAVEVAQELWGQLLMGATCSIQTLTTAYRVDIEKIVGAIEANPRLQAKTLARWLRAQVLGRSLIERRHFLAICSPSEATFDDSVQQINEGVGTLGFRADLIRRLQDDELRQVVRRTWSPRQQNDKTTGPRGPWNIGARQLQSDGEWHEVLSLGRWPRTLRDNCLAPFIDGPYAVDVVQHIAPIDPEDILDGLERRVDAMKATRPDRRRQLAISDMDEFIRALESGTEMPFDVATYFHLHGTDRHEVAQEARQLIHRVRRSGGRAQNMRWEQAGAMVAVAPLGVHDLKARTRRVDTSSIQRAYPWSASAMWPDGSVPWGETIDSKRPVGWTPWRRPLIANPHLVVYAVSGGGKGFGVKIVTSRLLFAGETQELFAFDQAEEDEEFGEYGRWAQYCGLEYRHIRTLADVPAALADLDNYRWLGPGICWNIAGLPLGLRPEVMVRTKEALFRRAAEHDARRQWVIDELWSFVKGAAQMGADPKMVAASNGAIEDVIRRGRHIKQGAVFMTQRAKDSLESELMQIIQSQAASQWYGMQMPAEITDIAPRLHWTPAEVQAVKRFIPGHGLLVAGPWRVTMRCTASEEEYAMANTDGKVERRDVAPSPMGANADDDTDDATSKRGDDSADWDIPEVDVREEQPSVATAAD